MSTDVRALVRLAIVTAGAIALVGLATAHLGLIGTALVVPIAIVLIAGAMMSADVAAHGRGLARSLERKADFARRVRLQHLAAKELERAAAILAEFVDDGSADADIERLRAQAHWDRKRGR